MTNIKSYRHKRTGNIATAPLKTVYGVFKAGRQIVGCPDEHIPKWLVEDSNDWELIEPKKDYEILFYKLSTCKKKDSCCISRYNRDGSSIIWSVKRLSDGEVFTIGDNVQHFNSCWDRGTIVRFEACNACTSGGYVVAHFENNGRKYHNSINVLKHSKKPLFTTEDGKEVFEGDKYYLILPNKFDVIGPVKSAQEVMGGFMYDAKHFSTKEAAEEYILMNKPCLSVSEVIETLRSEFCSDGRFLYYREGLLNGCKQLVKSRL